MWSVDVELIEEWLDALDRTSWKQVIAAIEVLARPGRSSAVRSSTR